MRRHHGIARIDVLEVEGDVGIEQIHVSFPKAVDGSDVLPVALEGIGEHSLARREHGGKHVLAEVVAGAFLHFVLCEVLAQLLPAEDVDTHGSVCALGMLGLLVKLIDFAVLMSVENAEARGFLERNVDYRDGAGGVLLLVVLEHLVVVHLVDVVARKNYNIVGVVALDVVDILVDRVRGARIPVSALDSLIGAQTVNARVHSVEIPRLSVADILVEDQRLILCQNADCLNARVNAV